MSRRLKLFFLFCLLSTAIASEAGVASANPIEGVWSFNEGRVAIQAGPGGTYTGTIVAPTKLDECVHSVGEAMWTNMTPQPDGSFWGLHQWFTTDGHCTPIPALGKTAWRVLALANGARYLRVCFSNPGSPKQPRIDSAGEDTETTFGCVDSERIATLLRPEPSDYFSFPSNHSCISRRKLRIHIRNQENDPLIKVQVSLRSHKIHRRAMIKRRESAFTAILNLKGLPTGRFTVKVDLTTALGEHLTSKRRYYRCASAKT